MTKEQLIELVGSNVQGHPQMIAMALGRAFNQLLYSTFRKDLSNLDLYAKNATGTIANGVCDLPQSIVQLPVPGDGIRTITPTKEKGVYFIPMSEHAMRTFQSFSTPSSYVGWCVRNGRIEFEETDVTDITISYIPPFDALDDEDEVYVPVGADVQLIGLTQQFLQIMPEKKVIDSNDKTR